MKFFKCLLNTIADSSRNEDIFTFNSIRYAFKDTTNPKYPKVEIWSNGEVYIYDPEDRVCVADDEMILHYCNMKDDELVVKFDSNF